MNQLQVNNNSVSMLDDVRKPVFYYVSDIHLEHQLELAGESRQVIQDRIEKKIVEMVSSAKSKKALLLIAGDTADSFSLSSLFYEILLKHWRGHICAVLGNHELWDTDNDGERTVDDIIAEYKAFGAAHKRIHFLENEMLIRKYESSWAVLSEQELLNMDPIKFGKYYDFSDYYIFGGIGFSGNNPVMNAQSGLYKSKVTEKEDKERSARFSRLHEKIRLLAGANRIIVLSHNPPQDWCDARKCSNWIYISGHNHQNSLFFEPNKPIQLSDNQFGFLPCKWELKAFEYECEQPYDPLEDIPDGIHCISSHEYMNFNRCRGIGMWSFKRQGTIYVIKHDGAYMFLLQNKKLYILQGGRIHVAEHPLSYYDEHLTQYISQVRKAFMPYDREKKRLGKEIRRLGGWGTDHGCIVDIDFYNHIYCNPFDGKMYFYYAEDIVNKLFYQDFLHLIRESPLLSCRELMLGRLESGCNVPALLPSIDKTAMLSVAAEPVSDTDMYKPSRIMRSVQYALDKSVIRLWYDSILGMNFDESDAKELNRM